MDNYDEYMLVEEGEPWPVHLSKDNAFFWLHCMACGILTPWSGIKPGPSAVRMRSPIHWTTKEFPGDYDLKAPFLEIQKLR